MNFRKPGDPGVNAFMWMKGQWPAYLSFKTIPGRKPVKGGRWSVRRNPNPGKKEHARLWRAYNHGKAQRWSRSFPTHDEAIRWAQHVARIYAEHGNLADSIMRNEREKARVSA